MINAQVYIESSVLTKVLVTGHADSNAKIVCAGVSSLVRTLCELVSRYKKVVSSCEATKPGEVMLVIHSFDISIQGELVGVTDFFLLGLIALANDSPESIKLQINNKEWYDGYKERWW